MSNVRRIAAICLGFTFFSNSLWATDIYIAATQAPTNIIGPTYFGTHFHRIEVLPTEKAIRTQWPSVKFGSMRLWDTSTRWGDVTPSPGVWKFERMDTFVNTGVQNKAEVLYTLGSTPRWASARPNEICSYGYGCGAETVRIAHWEEYVRHVSQRYGKRIHAYELWNEPFFSDFERDVGKPGFFTGSVKDMVLMAKTARTVLDETSPSTKLCSPGFVNGPDRLEKFLADGGSQYIQAICYHFYAEGSDHFAKQLVEVRAIMKRQGVENLPLWNTEAGVDTLLPADPPSGISARTREEAIARLNQLLIFGAAAGIERFYYYAWDNFRSGMVSASGQKLFGHDEMMKTQEWLLSSKFSGCKSNGFLVTCLANRGQEQSLFIWATKPTSNTISLPAGTKVKSAERLFGNEVKLTPSIASGAEKMAFDMVPIRFQLEQISTAPVGK